MPRLFLPAFFDPSVDRLIAPRMPLWPKMPLWKAVAFVGGLALSMLSYPVHAAAANGGDIVQGLYEALLSTRNTILQRLTWPETRVAPDSSA